MSSVEIGVHFAFVETYSCGRTQRGVEHGGLAVVVAGGFSVSRFSYFDIGFGFEVVVPFIGELDASLLTTGHGVGVVFGIEYSTAEQLGNEVELGVEDVVLSPVFFEVIDLGINVGVAV